MPRRIRTHRRLAARLVVATSLAIGATAVAATTPASAAAGPPTCAAGSASYLTGYQTLRVTFRPCDPQPAETAPTGYRVSISGAGTGTNEVAAGAPYTSLVTDFSNVGGAALTRITIVPFNEQGDSTALPTIHGAVLPWGAAISFVSGVEPLLRGVAIPQRWAEQADAIVRGEVTVRDLLLGYREFRIERAVEPVARLYQAYFLRLPDPGGLRYWVGKVEKGASLASVSRQFSLSPEFVRRYQGQNNRTFVTNLYLNAYGRPGDPGGIDFWTNRLDTGKITRFNLVTQFAQASEAVRKAAPTVGPLADAFIVLDRFPTSEEAAAWAALPNPPDDALIAIFASEAYYDHLNGN